MRGYVNMQQLSGLVSYHDKYIEHLKRRRNGDTEIAGDDRLGVVPDERSPSLVTTRFTFRALGHVFPYGSRRDLDPELQQQLISDPFLAPPRIVDRHSPNQ
jgi:hypothetical protein